VNIFYIHESAETAAQLLVDSHCIKMILESTLLLSTAHRLLDGEPYTALSKTGRKVKRWRLPDARETVLYSATHVNHPSTVWVRSGNQNYLWLYNHLVEMTREYTYRYGKRHKCCDMLDTLSKIPHNIPRVPFTQPTPAMDDKYIISEDSLENYRNYYREGKKHLHSWKNREVPDWIY
jgi:hypothetical protein